MNLTLFLGAGFSAAFGHPVMDTFLGFADGCKRLTDDDRNFLGRLVMEARRANSFLESSPTNLEDILSFSEMGDRLQLTDKDENRNSRLRSIVGRIYTTTPREGKYWPRYAMLKNLLGKDPGDFRDGELSFVTTNYDINIECACSQLGTMVDPGFKICQTELGDVQGVGKFYESGRIPLFKLHGSVNWYPSDAEPGLTVEDRVVRILPLGDEAMPSLPRVCASNYEPPADPVIIPPSFLKPDLIRALKDVWQGAAKVLSTASVVAFVGYSFPPSDTEMMFFLARALSENPGLRAVYIVDKKAGAITARLRSVGSKIGSHFRELIHPVEGNWTAVKGNWTGVTFDMSIPH